MIRHVSTEGESSVDLNSLIGRNPTASSRIEGLRVNLSLLLFLWGFAMSWLGVWAAFDVRRTGSDPVGTTEALTVPAAVALAAGLWASRVVFTLAAGDPLHEGVGVESLLMDAVVGILTTWFTLASLRRQGFWTTPLAALAIGAAIAVPRAAGDFDASRVIIRFVVETMLAGLLVWFGLVGAARVTDAVPESDGRRRVLGALMLGTSLGLAELTRVFGLPGDRALGFTPVTVLPDLRQEMLLAALLVAALLFFVDFEVWQHQRRHWQSFRILVEDSLDLVMVLRPQGSIRYSSPSAEKLLGYPVRDLRESPLAGLVHPDDLAKFSSAVTGGEGGDGGEGGKGRRVALRLRHAGAHWRDFEGTAAGRRGGELVLHLVDVTERIAAERMKRELARRDELILQSLGEGILGLDCEARVVFANDAGLAMLGLPQEDVVGEPVASVMRRAAREEGFSLKVTAAVRAALASGETQRGRDATLVHHDGREISLDFTVAPILVDDGITGAVALFVDVSQRRLEEEGRRRMEQRFLGALDLLNDAVMVENPDGVLVYVNRTAREVLGLEVGDRNGEGELLYGKLRLFTWEGAPVRTQQGPIADAVRRGQPIGYVQRLMRTLHGRGIYCLVEAIPWLDNGEQGGVLYALRDVSDIRRAQEEILKVRRIEALGVFAGGIAHDFNNILTIVLGNLSLARAEIATGSECDGLLESAEHACQQAAGLTRQLLTFSRGGAPVTRSVALGGLLEEASGYVLQGSRVKVDLHLPEDLWPIEADAGQIHQVITNIVLNASQAMPDGGSVEVQAENLRVGRGELAPLRTGNYVHLVIADHGTGIATGDLEHIFEPYFTTKADGHGLGLATCWSIVRRHGGHIRVQSRIGEGTLFHVYLPSAQSGKDAQEGRTRGPGRACRVLLLDDEREILSVSGEMLRRLGHTVTLARDGAEAVAACREAIASGRPFDVAILDLTIPGGMGGREAGARMREIDAHVRLIASSGYSNDEVMGDHRAYGFQGVLPKPYRRDELQAVVEAAALEDAADDFSIFTGDQPLNG